MNWTKIAGFPLEAKLTQLHHYLDSHGVHHRFTEEGGQQVLWLANPSQMALVTQYFKSIESGQEPRVAAPAFTADTTKPFNLKLMLLVFPVTIAIIVVGLVGYLVTGVFKLYPLVDHLAFLPLHQAVKTGELWRVISPTFLHFDILHILFNGLWIWELGRRIERFAGTRSYIVTFVITAIAANYLQYILTSGTLFGGLSGVVYAFLGYLMVWGRYHDSPLVKLPSGIYVFMLVWLLLGIVGVIDRFISGQVANGAHLGGLLAGLVIAAAEVVDYKRKRSEG